MSVFQSHIKSAEIIVSGFDGSIPFASYLKQYFSKHPKFGSKDRRLVSKYCYIYFRVSNLFPGLTFSEIVLYAIFLTESEGHPELSEDLNAAIHLSLTEKLSKLGIDPLNNLPFLQELSTGMDKMKFSLSLLYQPYLFIRMRPGKEGIVKRKLSEAGITFHDIGQNALSLEPQVKLQQILALDREAVVQDLQSQRVFDGASMADFFSEKDKIRVWDSCAGSGGKSLLLNDMLPGKIKITATDIRDSILHNYRKRMKMAGVPLVETMVADLTKANPVSEAYDLIIADVPCSGSGTWSRTPEQWHFFAKDAIDSYQTRQRLILSHVLPSLQAKGILVYITCSVFKKENEDNRDFIKTLGLQLVNETVLCGMEEHSDSMYVAVFRK
jgi:16S rRNA (cytosine967-C5)-methyltransferase